MTRLLAFAVVVLLVALAPRGAAFGQVIDGDTFRMGGVSYRLCGIDAPEHNHPGGPEATAFLRAFLAGKTIQCIPVGQGTPCDGLSAPVSYRRTVAQCFANGEDIAAAMVRSGHARDWPRFSGGYYARRR